MKPTDKQIKVLELIIKHLKGFQMSNDIDSPSHYQINKDEAGQISEFVTGIDYLEVTTDTQVTLEEVFNLILYTIKKCK